MRDRPAEDWSKFPEVRIGHYFFEGVVSEYEGRPYTSEEMKDKKLYLKYIRPHTIHNLNG